MLKQIPIDEALRRFVAGERVLCLVPGADADDWADYTPQMLNDILRDVIVFADEPIEPIEPPETIGKKNQGKTDVGKLYALSDAGWSPAKIADELGVSEQTVRNWLNKRGDRDDD